MIVTTDQGPKTLKGSAPLLNGQTNSSQPPPPYSSTSTYPTSQMERRQSPERRFFEALVIGAGIWFLVGMLTSSFYWSTHSHGRGRWQQVSWPGDGRVGWPDASDGRVERCNSGGDWAPYDGPGQSDFTYSSVVNFSLPTASDALYFLSRGAYSHGSITVRDDLDDSGSDAKVQVVVRYYTHDALDRANVCLMHRTDNEIGVGIFTPEAHWRGPITKRDQLQFEVSVSLPAGHSPLEIKRFETQLSTFVIDISDLAKTVYFHDVSLRTSNMPISVKSISAERASFKTSNAPIVGSFNTSIGLDLVTSNSPIDVEVGLLNKKSAPATELLMKTSNAPLKAALSLESSKSTGGSFKVDTATSNNLLKVEYLSIPVDSTLVYHARTSNGPAHVTLSPAYEGKFSVKTSNFRPSVEKLGVEDPSGKGRNRSLEWRTVGRNSLTGSVYWGKLSSYESEVTLRTSNSPATLHL